MTHAAHQCCHHKEGTACAAVRILEERVRKIEDSAHEAFHRKLKAPPRKRTVRKAPVVSYPVVKRNSKNPVCPGCSRPLEHAWLADISEATCTKCETYFRIS